MKETLAPGNYAYSFRPEWATGAVKDFTVKAYSSKKVHFNNPISIEDYKAKYGSGEQSEEQ